MDHVLCKLQSIIYNVNYLLFLFIYLFIFWLCWVFVSVRGLSLVAASGGHSSSRCAGLSLSWPLLLRSTGSRRTASVAVAHGHSCSAACGILPDQGSNPCPLHWQADSQPLCHQGSPYLLFLSFLLVEGAQTRSQESRFLSLSALSRTCDLKKLNLSFFFFWPHCAARGIVIL